MHIPCRYSSSDRRECRRFEQIIAERTPCEQQHTYYEKFCNRHYCRRDVDQRCVKMTGEISVRCRQGLECCFEDTGHQFCNGCIGDKCSNRTCGRDSTYNAIKRTSLNMQLEEPEAVVHRRSQQLTKVQSPISILYIFNRALDALEQEDSQSSPYS